MYVCMYVCIYTYIYALITFFVLVALPIQKQKKKKTL